MKINYWKIITYVVFALVVCFALIAIFSKYSIGGVKMLTVQSGSMEPTIKTGSLVFIKSKNTYNVGEIITFRDNQDPKKTFTHRIVDISGGTYQTKGDANDSPDSQKISGSQLLGKVELSIPYVGYVVAFSRTLPGIILLIIIPATIIIYDEIGNIKKEIMLKRKKKDENS